MVNSYKKFISIFLLLVGLFFGVSSFDSNDPKLKMNDIQVIGSHNSYKIAIEESLWKIINTFDSKAGQSLQYGHISLVDQLDLGLRNLELDVFYDPKGGHFSKPKGLKMVKMALKKPLPYDEEKKLEEPGLKLFHVQDLDFRSYHLLFKEGLLAIKSWSDKNPNHSPIIIIINAKDSKVKGTRDPLLFTKEALNEIDNEINAVFSNEKLITPDLVRGNFSTLEQAILTKGWPVLDSVKGRFLFVLDEKEDKINNYLEGHPSLKNRVLFVNSIEGNPEAAFRIINNPIKDFEYIQKLVAKGYMVRTRADADTKEARANDYSRFEKAKESGAQIISTDYYLPSKLFKSDFKVVFEKDTYERIKTK
ncbi:phosphatidylinositol-specific phospholipase C1-like protein [Flavobacterium algicola]|uniref:phosphatidylinositol-specific phospholipase C1-like protein n=1 Tax=Flavobacterium algicola TaxID=556529 RepID=UPI001EFC7504|nr:phosphatidylinositol-specific phospholipase C1-like protein [Flavobacterium algicola]MCG9793168.1 phosphatidylinositol-specific phospholipase C1-like protein [Flavobacterium algicola]